VREPAYFARQREEKPELPEGSCERESTPVTRMMSAVGSAIPTAAWRWRPVLGAMGRGIFAVGRVFVTPVDARH
jgi:hypothetical protein